MKRWSRLLAALALLGASNAVLAHPGHGANGFGAGVIHPFTGLDHLLATVAVGLWAAQCHRRSASACLLPAAFMLALAAGAALAMNGFALGWAEQGIATSVLALGLLVALAIRMPVALGIIVAAVFGMVHGYAHGLEIPSAALPPYASGFLLATAALQLSGLTLALAARTGTAGWLRIAGSVIAATGVGMLATL